MCRGEESLEFQVFHLGGEKSGETLSELEEFPFRLRNKNKNKGGKKGSGKLVDVKFCESFFFGGLLKNNPAFLNL